MSRPTTEKDKGPRMRIGKKKGEKGGRGNLKKKKKKALWDKERMRHSRIKEKRKSQRKPKRQKVKKKRKSEEENFLGVCRGLGKIV